MLTAPAAQAAAATVERRNAAPSLTSVLFYGVFSLLLFGPLAFGAVEAWSIFVLEAGAAMLFLLWAVQQSLLGDLRISANPLFPPMLSFAVLVLLQLATRHTAYHYATLSAALLYCAYGLLCFLAVQTLRRTSQVKTLAIIFSSYGSAIALFALIQSLSSNGKLYWLRTIHAGWIYGPYVNHNHYAGLMEMLVPIPLVFSLTRYARGPRKTMALAAAVVMSSTIFLSGSRGGMAAFAVQMAVLVALVVNARKGKRTALALGVFLVIVAGLLAWLGGAEITQRLASIHSEARRELSGGMRLDIDRDGLKMFARRPILGWGLGTFQEIYPQFRSFYTNFFIDKAHNDYLQLLAETGALGFGAMLWFLITLYRSAAKKLAHWMEDTNGAVGLAAMLGVTGILIHSFVDFNLQIPANAALFYVLCVVAAMEPRFGQSRRKPVRSQNLAPDTPL